MRSTSASLKRKIGQLFIAAVPLIREEKKLFKTIKAYINLGIGGFMIGMGGEFDFLETKGVTDIKKTKKFIAKLKKLDPTLFIAIDGEGGSKFNLFENKAILKQARAYGLRLEQASRVKQYKKDISDYVVLMKECGINMNFSPILGVARPGYQGYLSQYGRSYSDIKETVKMLSSIAIKEMQNNKIIAVGKHFPGYGPLDENPHQHLRKRRTDNHYDIRISAFAYAVRHGIQAIMKGHVLSRLDSKIPATLSLKVEEYLREELKFKGLTITDEIFMGSLNEYYAELGGDEDGTKRIVAAAKCNDILLHSYPKQEQDGKVKTTVKEHSHFLCLHQAVYQAVLGGEVNEVKFNESYERIIKYKKTIGLG
jgi:beta-N-acetylhexosaminidase